MAVSTLIITFGMPATIDVVKFKYTNFGSLTITSPVDDTSPLTQASSLAAYLNTNHSAILTASAVDNVVTITAIAEGAIFSNGAPQGVASIEFEYNNAVDPIVISGLEGDRYLINNEIKVSVTSNSPIDYVIVTLENLNNQKTSKPAYLKTNINNQVTFDISSIIKSLFEYPKHSTDYSTTGQVMNSSNKFNIKFSYGEDETILTKTFIRGGNRTTGTNQTISANATLRPSALLPVWTGYDTADYILNADNEVIKTLLAGIPAINIDYRRGKGCNELYIKFLNQRGGYSTWLFETNEEIETPSNLGSFIRNNEVADFGNESNSKLKVYGKIPQEYINLMKDLVVSPEIYALIDGAYVRITSDRNTIPKDPAKRSLSITLNFNLPYRFNPSIQWSN